MPNFTLTPNMNLIVPTPGQETGPQWATDLNNSLTLIDQHNHTPGYGVPVTSAALNINANLPLNANNLITARSVRFSPQGSPLAGVSDIGCLYESGVDLYYNDASGTQIRITQSGAVAGTPGSISSLVSPASASYNAGASTFIWQSDVSTPANMDMAGIVLRNLTASSKGLTISPPNAMASDISYLLPALPGSTSFLSMDSSGNISAATSLTGGITVAMLAAAVQAYFVPTGTINAYSGNNAPNGYLLCDGSSYAIASYPTLAAVLLDSITGRYIYGSSGSNFNVPDFRGRFLRGQDQGAGRDPNTGSRTAMNPNGNTGGGLGSVQANATAKNGLSISDPGHGHSTSANNLANQSLGLGASPEAVGNGVSSTVNANTTGITLGAGDAETRPINAYVNYIIKI